MDLIKEQTGIIKLINTASLSNSKYQIEQAVEHQNKLFDHNVALDFSK